MNNKYSINGDIVTIYINKGDQSTMECYISVVDLPLLMEYPVTWVLQKTRIKGKYYAKTDPRSPYAPGEYLLHRLITRAQKGQMVDHLDGNGLKNTRDNLKLVNNRKNAQNRQGAQSNNKSSGVRGVTWNKRQERWLAQAKIRPKNHYLGYHDTINSAIEALTKFWAERGVQYKP